MHEWNGLNLIPQELQLSQNQGYVYRKKSASIIFEKTMEALFIIYLSLSISEISEETKSDTQ